MVQNEEAERAEAWLTHGKPRVIRTRGVVRVRRVQVSAGVSIRHIGEVGELLSELKQEVPEAPWVVVVDGSPDGFVETVVRNVKTARESSKLWLVDSAEISEESVLADQHVLKLNPQDEEDMRFRRNLFADLAIIPTEPKSSRQERSLRWLSQARCLVTKELDEPLAKELETLEPDRVSGAEVFVLSG